MVAVVVVLAVVEMASEIERDDVEAGKIRNPGLNNSKNGNRVLHDQPSGNYCR